MTIGQSIANQRHQRRMTQEQLAEISDITINYLSKIERGVIKNISAETLNNIAQALNVKMEDLINSTPTDDIEIEQHPKLRMLTARLMRMPIDQSEAYSKQFIELLKLAEKK